LTPPTSWMKPSVDVVSAGRLGKYELVRHLASGGMARIYLARVGGVGGFERHVVLKTVRPERVEDDSYLTMFLDEARLLAMLHHQHVAQVYEVGVADDGTYFLAMEYLHGETVRASLAKARHRKAKLSLDYSLTVVAAAASGLHHAHERRGHDGQPLGIVHRDVSPSNVVCCYDGSVKLIDFGIAKAELRSTVTQTGFVKGKAGYMAPEQALGYKVDRRSDVYALGVVLYELTTQHRAFRAPTEHEAVQRMVRGDVTPPSKVVPGFPRDLEDVVLHSLELDPDDRFRSCEEMRAAIERVAAKLGATIGPGGVSRTLGELFGERPEPWLAGSPLADEGEQQPVTTESAVVVSVPDRPSRPPEPLGIPLPLPPADSQPNDATSESKRARTVEGSMLAREARDTAREIPAESGPRSRDTRETPPTRDTGAARGSLGRGSGAHDLPAPPTPTGAARMRTTNLPPLPMRPKATTLPPVPQPIAPSPSQAHPRPIAPSPSQAHARPVVDDAAQRSGEPAARPTSPMAIQGLPKTIAGMGERSKPYALPGMPRRTIPTTVPPMPRTPGEGEDQPTARFPTIEDLRAPGLAPAYPPTTTLTSAVPPAPLPPVPAHTAPLPPVPKRTPAVHRAPTAPRLTPTSHPTPPPMRTVALGTTPPPLEPIPTPMPATGTTKRPAMRRRVLAIALPCAALLGASLALIAIPGGDDAAATAGSAQHAAGSGAAPTLPITPGTGAASHPPAPSAAHSAPADVATAPAGGMIKLHVVSDPAGGTVVLDGVRLGTAPFDGTVPAEPGKEATLKVRMHGYVAVKQTIQLDRDVTWNVHLHHSQGHSSD